MQHIIYTYPPSVIRTFIKGSIEAWVSLRGVLPKESFVNIEKLGKNRCRVPADQREYIYNEYERYEKNKKDLGLWDDCDRVRHVLLKLDEIKRTDPSTFDNIRKSKLYCDEIQDYTQIEVLLFFYR